MNLTGATLGGYVQQGNINQEMAVKRGQLGLQMGQLAAQRMQATLEMAAKIKSSLPTDADVPRVAGTLQNLGRQYALFAQFAGLDPATAFQSFQSQIDTTPTIQTAAQQQGGAKSTALTAAAPGTAINAAAQAGGTKAGELPYSVTDIRPGGAAVPTANILGAPGAAPAAPPAPAGAAPPAAIAPSAPPAPGGSTPAPGAPGGGASGVVPVPGGGLANTNSPALVNLTQGNQPAYLDEMGKAVANFITDKQKSIAGYQDALNAISELRPTLLNTKTGGATATEISSNLNKFASRFGVDLNKYLPEGWQVDPNKYDVANKAITQLATAFAKGNFPNRITNNDMQIAINATPNFGNTPAANSQLLDNLEGVVKLRGAEAAFYRQREQQYRDAGKVPGWSIIDEWQSHLSQMKGVSPQLKQAFMASDLNASPAVGGAPAAPANIPSANSPTLQYVPGKGIVPMGQQQ